MAAMLMPTVLGMVTQAKAAATRFDVTTYGAVGDGATDSTIAIRNAIAAAQAAGPGNIVYFPTGHYVSNLADTNPQAIEVTGTNPVTFQGDGPSLSILSERQLAKDLLSIKVDGSGVNNMTLDSQTGNARVALKIVANRTLVKRVTVLGGDRTFALFYPGPPGASRTNLIYNTYNKVTDVVINDKWNRDGFSFAFQMNGLVQNIDHTGTRLALFGDKKVHIKNYTYHPGTAPGGNDGFWITPPTDSVTISNFVTDGDGGVLGAAGAVGFFSTNISITGEVFRQPGHHLSIGDVKGLTIDGCNMGSNNILRFNPPNSATKVLVKNCSSLPIVRFLGRSTTSISAEFDNNTYPTFAPPPQTTKLTFQNTFGGPTDFIVKGGTLQNCSGGFFKGTHTTYMVIGLTGYPCKADTPPTAALNVTPTSGKHPLAVTADASGSTDSDSTPIANYRFDFGDGTVTGAQTAATAPHTYTRKGTFKVTVYVVDTIGVTSTASVTVTST